ncbi:MAG: hypothetical protein K8R90_11835 [Candidatus Cloacimonetes bacterium]|nr:hypothetical protein [Candidatus Cloacimonadota bacterium]
MPKQLKAFGVYQDGDELRIATVLLDGETLLIDSLYKERMAGEKEAAELAMQDQFASPFDEPTQKNGGAEIFDFGESDDKKEDEALEFEELDVMESFDEEPNSGPGQDALANAATAVQMTSGLVCTNMDVSNIKYRRITIPTKTPAKKINSEVHKAFYSPEQQAITACSYFGSNEQDEVIGIRHQGSMDLLENLVMVNQENFNSEFGFCMVQPNEVALMNAIRYNYEIFGSDVIAIFYIGVDFSRITLMQGEHYLLDLPIINEGYGSDNILNTVYSRFLLEKAHHNIPSLDRIYLAGSGLSEETLELLREKEPDASIQYLLPLRLMDQLDTALDYTNEELAEFIIPIMLAVVCLLPREPLLFQSNFLPKQLRQQKAFALGFGGVIILAAIFAVILLGMNGIIKQRSAIRKIESDIQELAQRIEINMGVIKEIQDMEGLIFEHESNLMRFKHLIGNRNQWHYILEEISGSYLDNYLSWSTNIFREDDGQFRLKGSTTRRQNIVAFSLLFPNGRIDRIVEKEIEGYTVWDYDIAFSMPDQLHTQKLDLKREGIDITPPTLERNNVAAEHDEAPSPTVTQPVAQPQPNVQPIQQQAVTQQQPATQQQPVATTPAVVKGPAGYDEALTTYFRGDLAGAAKLFETFIEGSSSPWVSNATYFLGEILYRQQSYPAAIKKFEEVLAMSDRKQPESLMMLGNACNNIGQANKAIGYWNTLVADYPTSQFAALAKRKINEAGAE